MKTFSWDVFFIKITSRKLWVAFAGLATSIMAYLNCDSNTIVQVTSIIAAIGTVVGYLIANGLTDMGDTTKTDITTPETTVENVVTAITATDTNTAAETAAAVEQVTSGLGSEA